MTFPWKPDYPSRHQRRWLRVALQSSRAIWAVVVLVSCGTIDGDSLPPAPLGTTGTGFDDRAYTVLKQGFSLASFSFEPQGEYHNPRFDLTFRVTQGGTQDIELLVFMDAEFQKWDAGLEATSLYASGRVMGAQVIVPVPDLGEYRIVLNNRFSDEVGRTVVLTAWLLWETPSVPSVEAP